MKKSMRLHRGIRGDANPKRRPWESKGREAARCNHVSEATASTVKHIADLATSSYAMRIGSAPCSIRTHACAMHAALVELLATGARTRAHAFAAT